MIVSDVAQSPGDIMRRLAAIEAQLRELGAARRLEAATIGAGGLTVAGGGVIASDDFDGDMSAGSPGTLGWALGANRLALLGALLTPVDAASVSDRATNYAVSTSYAAVVDGTFNRPSWANRALVHVSVSLSTVNPTAVTEALYLKIDIAGQEDGPIIQPFDPYPAAFSLGAQTLAWGRVVDNPGPTIPVSGLIHSANGNWSAVATNFAVLSATAIFLRVP